MKTVPSRRRRPRRRADPRTLGQATIEYMLLLGAAAGECGVVIELMLKFLPKVFNQVECMINNPTVCPLP